MAFRKLRENAELTLWEALIPVIVLVALLAYNVLFAYNGKVNPDDDPLNGSNQFLLLIGAAVAAIVGFYNHVDYDKMIEKVGLNLKDTSEAILILLMVGALSSTWILSGIIPTIIFGGIQLLNPVIFLPIALIICSIVSLFTGSSWSTSATVGIAMIGIGSSLGISPAIVAGAVISGAYFGDKMSPLSDTTNLAPAMAGTTLFAHINYMKYTTFPTYTITLIFFIILGLTQNANGVGGDEIKQLTDAIDAKYFVSPLLMIVPVLVIVMIVRKTKPLIALLAGTLLGGLFSVIFQPSLVAEVAKVSNLDFHSLQGIMENMVTDTSIEMNNEKLNSLFGTGGMKGMLSTIWLIICAMVFGGVMDAIGALARISKALLSLAHSIFGLFASTVASCLTMNLTASDQYIAIVVPGKMFAQAYKDKGLDPVNLSRTLEDTGTVTSALIPWNTCGAYQSKVLGVGAEHYFIYAMFNWLSPIMTLIFAYFRIKIKYLTEEKKA
ncbi:MAG: Na+/H+ antiporter NhaC [Saprospiraceae bacterium]|nr:Na+/H+ antiporter NhaC [Saprospiraceae bacterium]